MFSRQKHQGRAQRTGRRMPRQVVLGGMACLQHSLCPFGFHEASRSWWNGMSFMVMCVEVVFTSRTSFRVKYGRRWRARLRYHNSSCYQPASSTDVGGERVDFGLSHGEECLDSGSSRGVEWREHGFRVKL